MVSEVCFSSFMANPPDMQQIIDRQCEIILFRNDFVTVYSLVSTNNSFSF